MTEQNLKLKGRDPRELLIEIRALIEEARRQTAVAVNMALTLLYWSIGKRLHQEVLGSERAAYGEQIVATLRVASNGNVTRSVVVMFSYQQ
jgi:hypothetical protein